MEDLPQHWEVGRRLPGALAQEQVRSCSSGTLQRTGKLLIKQRKQEGKRMSCKLMLLCLRDQTQEIYWDSAASYKFVNFVLGEGELSFQCTPQLHVNARGIYSCLFVCTDSLRQ